MLRNGDGDGARVAPSPAVPPFRLDAAVADLYRSADLADGAGLAPLLGRLLAHSTRLLHVVAGSVSVVDAGAARYAKVAERGAPCRLGSTFPLAEGLTGRAVARRRPVVLEDYRQVGTAHVSAGHPAGRGSAAAVPIWWRGDVLGVTVAFAGTRRRFTAGEVDAFELLSQAAAGAIVRAGAADPALGPLLRRGAAGAGPSPLTPREREVLALLAGGRSDRDIATALVVSPKTVEKHVGAVLRKTGTSSRTGAVMRALEQGWLPRP